MARVLITGMSGAGKTTLLGHLADHGHLTVETDDDGWTLPDGRWDAPRMTTLLGSHPTICVSGTVENQGDFYDRFAHVVLLSAPLEVLLHRLATRHTNPYGRSAADRADVRRYLVEVEPVLRRGASMELDGTRPVAHLTDEVERLLLDPTPSG